MNVRMTLRRDLDGQADLLTAAFLSDPVFGWMYPDQVSRHRHLREWFGAVLGFAFNHGHCYRLGEDAAAVWIPPDVEQLNPEERSAIVGLVARQLGEERAIEIARGFGAASEYHPADPSSMLLWYVGVRPGLQGQGLGQAVLAPVIARLDGDGLHAYLHSTNERNLPFYGRLGWSTLAEVALPAGPSIRPMWRVPR